MTSLPFAALVPQEVARSVLQQALRTAVEAEDAVGLGRLLDGFPEALRSQPWWRVLQGVRLRFGQEIAASQALLLDHALAPDDPLRALAAVMAAANAYQQCEPDTERRFEEASALPPLAWDWLQATHRLWHGIYLRDQGRLDESRTQLVGAHAGFARSRTPKGQALSMRALALQAHMAGRYAEAEACLQTVLAIARESHTLPLLSAFGQLAQLAVWRHDVAGALGHLDRGLLIATATGDTHGAALLQIEATKVHMIDGDVSAAEAALGRAAALLSERSARGSRLTLLSLQTQLSLLQGDLPSARNLQGRYAELLGDSTDHQRRWWYFQGECRLTLATGDGDLGRTQAEDLLSLAGDNASLRALALDLLAEAGDLQGDALAAADARQQLTTLCQDVGLTVAVVTAYHRSAARAGDRPPTLQIRCLGEFDVRRGDGTSVLDDMVGTKPAEILALLVLEPEGASSDEIIRLLYPDGEVSRSAIALMVSRLRRAISPDGRTAALLHRKRRYRFAPDLSIHSDVAAFHEAWQQARQAEEPGERAGHYRRMIALYGGALLKGLPAYSWLVPHQQRTWQRWLEAVTWLAEQALGDDVTGCLAIIDQALIHDPVAEALNRLKLAALLRWPAGGKAAAERHLTAWQATWQKHYDQDLSPAFWQWWQQVSDGADRHA